MTSSIRSLPDPLHAPRRFEEGARFGREYKVIERDGWVLVQADDRTEPGYGTWVVRDPKGKIKATMPVRTTTREQALAKAHAIPGFPEPKIMGSGLRGLATLGAMELTPEMRRSITRYVEREPLKVTVGESGNFVRERLAEPSRCEKRLRAYDGKPGTIRTVRAGEHVQVLNCCPVGWSRTTPGTCSKGREVVKPFVQAILQKKAYFAKKHPEEYAALLASPADERGVRTLGGSKAMLIRRTVGRRLLAPTGKLEMFAGSGFGMEFQNKGEMNRWLVQSGTLDKMIEQHAARKRAKYERTKARKAQRAREQILAEAALGAIASSGDSMDAEDGDAARAFVAMNVPQGYADVLRLSPRGSIEDLAGMFGGLGRSGGR